MFDDPAVCSNSDLFFPNRFRMVGAKPAVRNLRTFPWLDGSDPDHF
jgi:hypothetical protein